MRSSTRERLQEIALLLEEGMPQKDIAAHLGISESRVSSYKARLTKLNIHDAADNEIVAVTLFPTRNQLESLSNIGDPRNILMRIIMDIVEGEIHINYGTSLPRKERIDLDAFEAVTPKASPLIIEPELEALLNEVPHEAHSAPGISPHNSADETEPPKRCPEEDCHAPDVIIYADERVWQCEACLAEGEY